MVEINIKDEYICYLAENIIRIIENNDAEITVDTNFMLVHYKISLEALDCCFPELSEEDEETIFEELDEQICDILGMRYSGHYGKYEDFTPEELMQIYGYDRSLFVDERGRYSWRKEAEEGAKFSAWLKEREKAAGYHLKDGYLFVPARGEGREYLPI